MAPTKSNEPPNTAQAALPHQPPRLCYFISRSNGNIVPLIPADELPYSVRLKGVQRVMKMENTCGMNHVGTLPSTGQYFRLDIETLPQALQTTAPQPKTASSYFKQFFAPDATARQVPRNGPAPTSHPSTDSSTNRPLPLSSTATNWRSTGSENTQAMIDAIVSSESRTTGRSTRPTTPSSGSSPDDDKVYCSFWISRGECNFTQQGCRYKHEMPDRATLASIGFRDYPRWWKEKAALRLGQGAISMGEPARGPEEFMRDESESESESEGEEEMDKRSCAAKKKAAAQPTKTADSSSDENESTAFPVRRMDEQAKDTLKDQTLLSAHTASSPESTRRLSTADDLIEFSPAASSTTTPNASSPLLVTSVSNDSLPLFKQVASPSKVEREQSRSPPRKVFVPAGESTSFHIAEARKHAQSQPAHEDNAKGKQDVSTENTSHGDRKTKQAVKPLKRPEGVSGLMASRFAPHPTPKQTSRMPRQTDDAATSKSQKDAQPLIDFIKSDSQEKPMSDPVVSNSPASARAKAKATSLKPDAAKTGSGSGSGNEKQKPRTSARSRRPAGSGSKTAHSKAKGAEERLPAKKQ